MAGEAGTAADILNEPATLVVNRDEAPAPPTDAAQLDAAAEIARLVGNAPYELDFYQVLRRLECARPSLPRLGYAQRADHEPVRFGQIPSLAFAPSTVAAFKPGKPGRPGRLLVSFIGLLGPNGPLPHHITEYVRDRERNSADPTLARFLDIFHHRVIALFYRAWGAAQRTVSHQRPADDRFAAWIASLIGLGEGTLRGRDAVNDLAKLYFAGRLAGQTRPPEGLAGILEAYFGVAVRLEEFVGQWLALDVDRRLRLGRSRATGTLGQTSVIGATIWDRQQKYRLVAGPMDFESYQRFLPGGTWLPQALAWCRTYAGDELAFELRLILRAASIPQTRLGKQGRLGWSTWMNTKPPARDAGDLILKPATPRAA